MRRVRSLLLVFAVVALFAGGTVAKADDCRRACTSVPGVDTIPGALTATYLSETGGGVRVASNRAPGPQLYVWRLRTSCEVTDASLGGCVSDAKACPVVADRVIQLFVVERKTIAQSNGEGPAGEVVPAGTPIGSPFGPWAADGLSCVDVTDLNPAPTPDEVYRYFRTLPLPALPTIQQPPGTALVGLPVVFHTDGPTTQTYDLTIRGFAVSITATATTYTWHTGDGTDLTTASPGAPWPDTTATHTYRSGTYTSSLTTTWTATFTIDTGPATPVPGTTTTTGPTTTFTVVQAHPVLTNPYD